MRAARLASKANAAAKSSHAGTGPGFAPAMRRTRATATAAATAAPMAHSPGAGGTSDRLMRGVAMEIARRRRVSPKPPRSAGRYHRRRRLLVASVLKLLDVWRVIREMDLESIRRDA